MLKRTIYIRVLAGIFLLALFGALSLPAFASGDNYDVRILGRVDTTVRHNSRDTYVVELQVRTRNGAVVNRSWACELSFDTSVFELVSVNGANSLSDAGISLTPGAPFAQIAAAHGFSSLFPTGTPAPWQALLLAAISGDGERGFVSMQAMTLASNPREFSTHTPLQRVRFAFRPGKSLENVSRDTIRLISVPEMREVRGISNKILINDGRRIYEYGLLSGRPSTLSTPDLDFEFGIPDPPYGDVDGNGIIDAADVTLLRRYIAARDREEFLLRPENVNFNTYNADTDGNGYINSSDVTLLRIRIAG